MVNRGERMKILITGGSGLLGKSLAETTPDGFEIALTYHENRFPYLSSDMPYKFDVRDPYTANTLFDFVKPDVVIHAAAIGSVDYTETHYDEVRAVNFVGTQHIVKAANKHNAKMIYISSNAVYSGRNPPYSESMATYPVNLYGKIKRLSEEYITSHANSWLIIRPFLLYGWPHSGGRGNWASSIVAQLENKKGYKLVDDNIWMPTYAPDCAKAIWKLMENENDIFNVAGPEESTLYQFGLQVCDVFGLDKRLLKPVSIGIFDYIAARPQDTTYDLIKLNGAGIKLSDLKTGLEQMKAARNV
jgi:dTDP-4-dehydrorhamnose reductase